MLTNRSHIIAKLIELAARLRDLIEGGPTSAARNPITLAELIESSDEDPALSSGAFAEPAAHTHTRTTEESEDRWDAAREIECDGDAMRLLGWLQGYAELAAYDNVGHMLKEHGIDQATLHEIYTGKIAAAPPDNREPAPARLYLVLKESIAGTTRMRLEHGPITIRNTEHDVLDEYARQAAQTLVGLLGL